MLARLRKRHNRISDELASSADVIVAASRVAADPYRERWPHKDVTLVNHHVDSRVAAALSARPVTTFAEARIAYFGELVNTVQSPRIDKLVDFTLVDTSRQDATWFDRLPDYNLHYARQTRALDQH